MAWIKFDKDLVDDPRIVNAAEMLAERYTLSIETIKGPGFASGSDVDEAETVALMRNAVTGALVALWVYADTHIREGDELPISVTAVDRMVGIQGFCAIVGEDWIRSDTDGATVILPGYCEKNGLISKDKRKTSNADRQRRYRERQRGAGNVERNAATNAVSNAVTRNDVTPLDQDLDQDQKKSRSNSARKGSRLPSEWVPSEILEAWAIKERPDLDMAVTTARFRDYYAAAPGAKGVKLDWEATFRNWVRNERPGQRQKDSPMYRREGPM